MSNLSNLPLELVEAVSAHLENPRDVHNLSLTCRHLGRRFAHGSYRGFLGGRFLPYVTLPGTVLKDPIPAIHGLSTLYRNWQRRALVSRFRRPSGDITYVDEAVGFKQLSKWTPSRPVQTMGRQPHIDSYETWLGGNWTSRRESLVCGAGTDIFIRTKHFSQPKETLPDKSLDDYNHPTSWYVYKNPGSIEGVDDITGLKALREHQGYKDGPAILYGTASGQLSLLHITDTSKSPQTVGKREFQTDGHRVTSLDVSSSGVPLLTAVLGRTKLALYQVPDREDITRYVHHHEPKNVLPAAKPISILTPDCGKEVYLTGSSHGRIWSSNFLSENSVAIGVGPSSNPIQIFDVGQDGISSSPLRTFSLDVLQYGGASNILHPIVHQRRNATIYPVIPLPCKARGASHRPGEVFLSGGYDGIIRLHDMRSPSGFESMFFDPTNDNAVYCLQTHGQERLLAGTSMNSMVKIFDLRLSGSSMYQAIPVTNSKTKQGPESTTFTGTTSNGDFSLKESSSSSTKRSYTNAWNLFLHPRTSPYERDYHRHGRTRESPIYSLSLPSDISPFFYAGVENEVIETAITSILDPFPDPIFKNTLQRDRNGEINVKYSWNPRKDVMNVSMYDQGDIDRIDMELLVQKGVGRDIREDSNSSKTKALDDRWKDPREEIIRFNRGRRPNHRRGGAGGWGRSYQPPRYFRDP